jgi:Dolichyl-phosphate-mannose-protein mannosyltransferase
MDERGHDKSDRVIALSKERKVLMLLLVVLLTAGLMRAFNIGHTLMYDEAWNSNTVADGATGHTAPSRTSGVAPDNWFGNFYRHPPLYLSAGIAYAAVTGSGRYGASIALEILSILAAIALALVVFLCGRDWFGDYAGLAAAFLFAVMPAARMLDSLVKAEPLTLLFVMFFLLFFFRKKYWLAGLMLGLGLLTKEVAVFIPAALVMFLLIKRRWPELKGFGISAVVAIAISFWWYVFLSSTSGEFADFFFGRSAESAVWHRSWSFYLTRIPADWGWPLLILLVLGVVLLLFVKKAGGGERRSGFSRREHAEFALLAVVLIFALLSLSYGKPPWMIYCALPVAALLGGWALVEAATWLAHGRVAVTAVLVVLAIALALSIPVSFATFMKKGDLTYVPSTNDRATAEYVNGKAGDKGTMMLKLSGLSPSIAFYLESYGPGSMVKVPPVGLVTGRAIGEKYSLYLLYDDTTAQGLLDNTRNVGPRYVLVRDYTGRTSKPGESFTASDVSAITRPSYTKGNTLLFEGSRLVSPAGAAGTSRNAGAPGPV